MQDDDSSPGKLPINIEEPPDKSSGVSRRDFLKISGLAAAAVPAVASPKTVMAAGQQVSSGGFEEIVRRPKQVKMPIFLACDLSGVN